MPRSWPALLIAALLVGCDSALPAPTATATPTSTFVAPAATAPGLGVGRPPSETGLPRPKPFATTCPRPTPSLVPALVFQNGNLDLNAPYRLGFVQFFVVPCRDIDAIRTKYGLGPLERVITEPPNPNSDLDDIRGRYYRSIVPAGEEPPFVARLAAHPEDFQYVEFAFIPRGCVPEGPPLGPLCFVSSTLEPTEGAAGTSFKMQICCFPEGTPVTKTFTLPGGRTIVIPDTARQDQTVLAGWGGSADDERGTYIVTVTGDQVGSMVRFRIR